MYIKKLIIETSKEVIRELEFTSGLNLIIDDTPADNRKSTGNNVGKTTVLKLIDFCLGAKSNIIYSGTENKKDIDDEVKRFLIEESVKVTLLLVEELDCGGSKDICIERDFLPGKRALRRINGQNILEKDYDTVLKDLIIPNQVEKPTFRQIISHNIRYKEENISNTLKTLNQYTRDTEYETLYLFLLGCPIEEGGLKQELTLEIKQEKIYRQKLENNKSLAQYEFALSLVEEDIQKLNDKKKSFGINEQFEKDLESLNNIRFDINKYSSKKINLDMRINMIKEAIIELQKGQSNIDIKELEQLYREVKYNIKDIQKTFEELVVYHNKMLYEKVAYITKDLPKLECDMNLINGLISKLLHDEKELTQLIAKGDSFEDLEDIISSLNEKHKLKGEYESVINQMLESEERINKLHNKLDELDSNIFSKEFYSKLKNQVHKFNTFFKNISDELYGETYALHTEMKKTKMGQPIYEFSSVNGNLSSGKKQGEIVCFDIAYHMFAKEEKIPVLNFLLNDKKELMHDNQLIKIADYIKNKNIQLVVSMLSDKIPEEVYANANIVTRLSQNEKLFKM